MVYCAVTKACLAGDVANIKAASRAKVGACGDVQDLFFALYAYEFILFFGTRAHSVFTSLYRPANLSI
ncbi:hypothetical protein D3C80_1796700 [compost metagenome]